MTRLNPTENWRPAKSISTIDQRLAAAMHLRQIETIVRSEVVANSIGEIFDRAESAIVMGVIERKRDLAGILLESLARVKQHLLNDFQSIADWSRREAVDAFLDSIPIRWFKSLVPPETAVMLEDERPTTPGEDQPPLVFDTPTEPIATNPDLTEEEKRELVEKLIFPPPSFREVAAIVTRGDWQERFDTLSGKITDRRAMLDQLVTGFSDGGNVTQLRKNIQPLVSGIRSSAQRIARTEGLRIAEQVQRREWDSLGDMMTGVQVLAVLDENTRPHHAARNGTIYHKDPKGGQKGMNDLPDLPDEPNCRCWSTPVLRPPKELENDPDVAAAFKNATGAGIPDPATYDQWFNQVDEGRRKMAVGVRRYSLVKRQLFKIREPEWTDFIDENGKLLSIAELEKESTVTRMARKEAVAQAIQKRGRDRVIVNRQGFIARSIQPTLVSGNTYTGEVDPNRAASVLGELIRTKLAKNPPKSEGDLREIGSFIREYIETPELKQMAKQLGELDRLAEREIEKLKRTGRMSESAKDTIRDRVKLIRDYQRMKQSRFFEIMSSVRDIGTVKPLPVSEGSNVAIVRLLHESQRFFPSDWLDRFAASKLSVHFETRGRYLHSRGFLSISDSGDKGRRSTMVHELMHRAEFLVPGFRKSLKEMYERRTKRSKLRKISYTPDDDPEWTYRNSWFGNKKNGFGEYMGRKYPSDNFEIATMAMEGICWGTYPIEDDPEVYDLVLGALASL